MEAPVLGDLHRQALILTSIAPDFSIGGAYKATRAFVFLGLQIHHWVRFMRMECNAQANKEGDADHMSKQQHFMFP